METVTEERGSAVDDHLEAESERSEAEAAAALEAQAARDDEAAAEAAATEDLDNEEPGPEPTPEEPAAAELAAELAIELDGQLSFGVGGKKPTGATLRLTGGKVEIAVGELKKGSAIAVRVEAIVDDVGFKDQTDVKTGQVVGCERRHKARITNVELIEA